MGKFTAGMVATAEVEVNPSDDNWDADIVLIMCGLFVAFKKEVIDAAPPLAFTNPLIIFS